MSKVFFGTLISQAQGQIKSVVPCLVRAGNGFLPKASIEAALYDLKECQRLLELAKASLPPQQAHRMDTQSHPLPLPLPLHTESRMS